MDRDTVSWEGPIPAVVTPFAADGAIDERAYGENVERVLSNGAAGVLVTGCTGEFWSLSDAERVRLMRLGVEAAGGRGVVLAGTSAIEIERAIALTNAAEEAGCDGAVVLPPWFVRLSDDAILAHFAALSDATGLPIVAYNIPANATNALTPPLASRLADVPNVVAIKESSGDWMNFYETLVTVRDRIRVFCGPSHWFGAAATLAGADGTIDIFPNVWLKGCNDIFHHARAGRVREAFALQEKGFGLERLFTGRGMSLYVATKHAMNALGLSGGRVRPPFVPLSPEQAAFLEDGIAREGLPHG